MESLVPYKNAHTDTALHLVQDPSGEKRPYGLTFVGILLFLLFAGCPAQYDKCWLLEFYNLNLKLKFY